MGCIDLLIEFDRVRSGEGVTALRSSTRLHHYIYPLFLQAVPPLQQTFEFSLERLAIDGDSLARPRRFSSKMLLLLLQAEPIVERVFRQGRQGIHDAAHLSQNPVEVVYRHPVRLVSNEQ